jgi:hypothetical protein
MLRNARLFEGSACFRMQGMVVDTCVKQVIKPPPYFLDGIINLDHEERAINGYKKGFEESSGEERSC